MMNANPNPVPAVASPALAPPPATAPAPAPSPAAAAAAAVRGVGRVPVDVEFARQDALRACNPDIDRPFSSLEDACDRLLPFHVLADYDADDVNDKFLDSTGRVLSRSQLWNESLTAKIHEFKATLQKQLDVFNALSKKRTEGEMRAEEGLMIEQFLFQDEKQKVLDMKAEMERQRAERDAEARMKEAMERARIEQARSQEAARQQVQNSGLLVPGANVLGDSFCYPSGAQTQEECNNGPELNSPEQDGEVDGMLEDWDEEGNESINLLAHGGAEAGTLDLNALT